MAAHDGRTISAEMIGSLHQKLIFGRRVQVLAKHLAAMIPPAARVLDVGCGDGVIDRLIYLQRPDVIIQGIDVLVRENAHIPVKQFDGITIPYPDSSFDVVMMVDVLHHTVDPLVMIKEAQRVGSTVLIKDHFRDGFLANETLRLMDWVGNARHGVALPYNYWAEDQWKDAFAGRRLQPVETRTLLNLYPWPISMIFERNLHFIALLENVGGRRMGQRLSGNV